MPESGHGLGLGLGLGLGTSCHGASLVPWWARGDSGEIPGRYFSAASSYNDHTLTQPLALALPLSRALTLTLPLRSPQAMCSSYNEDPKAASRPFDSSRAGLPLPLTLTLTLTPNPNPNPNP